MYKQLVTEHYDRPRTIWIKYGKSYRKMKDKADNLVTSILHNSTQKSCNILTRFTK